MKTYKNLWNKFITFDNLYDAAKKAQKSKRFRDDVLKFNFNLESNIFKIQNELESEIYKPGKYKQFTIFEPKKRLISSAPYRDRVVHHAVNTIIEPIWENRFYYHSYACREGKGSHKALDICQKYLRKNKYVLKCDIEKYFPSIDHKILKQLLRKKIADQKLISLLDTIIDSSPEENNIYTYYAGDNLFTPANRRKGIPIGNLTSQFFANLYLNELDQWIKNKKQEKYYLRYMDDFIIFHDSKEHLNILKLEIKKFLNDLRLSMHKKKQQIYPVKNGVPFLGFHIFNTHRRLKKENIRLFIKRMKFKQDEFIKTQITLSDIEQSLKAWIGHAKHGNTYNLREDVFKQLVF